MRRRRNLSDFIRYLVSTSEVDGSSDRLPSLNELSHELGISVSRLREQLEVARTLGFVEVRPRTGIRRLPFAFLPAVRQSLGYAIEIDRQYFEEFSDLRKNLEAAYWYQAVEGLTSADHDYLRELIESAWEKLRGTPVRIPHREHRELHLSIFRRLQNPFVLGILEAYWEAYEAVGLNLFTDYPYLEQVWKYHEEMVDAISRGDFERGYRALVDHTDLIYRRPASAPVEADPVSHVSDPVG